MPIQKAPYVAPIKGLALNMGGTLVDDQAMTNCQNVYISRTNNVKKRDGYSLLGQNLPLFGTVMNIDEFYLTNGASYLVAITTTDVYYYDVGGDIWVNITPTYSTGTVDRDGTDQTELTITTGNWTTGGVIAGDFIGLGDTDANNITTWYEIDTVTSATEIHTVDNLPVTTGSTFVVRKVYTGTISNLWETEIMNDLFIFTNGIDNIQKWNGSDPTAEDLGGNPPPAKYLKKYHDYLVLGYTTETNPQPVRVRWCDTGDCEQWDNPGNINNAGWLDLIDGVDFIIGMEELNDRLIVFKERNIYTGYLVTTTSIFQFDLAVSGTGCLATNTIGAVGDELIFMGWDNIYAFDGITANAIGDPVKDALFTNLNPQVAGNSHCLVIDELDEYILMVASVSATYPDTEWRFNYRTHSWTLGTRANITRTGFYTKQFTYTWLTYPGVWLNANTRWGDRSLLAEAPTNLFGDSGGYIYQMDYVVTDDNGVAIDAYMDTKDFTQQVWDMDKYWCRLDVYGYGNTVDVYYSIDEGVTYTLIGNLPFVGTLSRQKVDFRVTSESIRFRFRNSTLGETFQIRMFDLYWDKAGRV